MKKTIPNYIALACNTLKINGLCRFSAVSLAVFLFLSMLCAMDAQAQFPKIPLLERFTNASCPPCASYNKAGYLSWVAANNDVTIIHYQVSWPGTDPMYTYNKSLPMGRVSFYGTIGQDIDGVPTVKLEGKTYGSTQPSNAMLTSWKNATMATTSPMLITPMVTMVGSDKALVQVKLTSQIAMSNVKLHIVLVQLMVSHSTPPGSNGEKDFPYVARKSFPNENMSGEVITIAAGGTITREYTATGLSALNAEEFTVIAFVQSNAAPYEIIQSGNSANTSVIPIEITLDPQGGEVEPTKKIVVLDFAVGELPTPTRTNYTFVKWNSKPDGSGVTYTSTTSYTDTSVKTLYAIWEGKKFTLTFNPLGGEVDATPKTVTYGQPVGTLPIPTKTGFIFEEWNSMPNRRGIILTDTTVFLETADVALYAFYKQGTSDIPVSQVEFAAKELNLSLGYELELEYSILPSDATNKVVSWTSTNPSVASVNDGVVFGLTEGE
ncbi:MAG: InlB B-repeat-containing protein, partial [Ignavibacteria bacterium]|nr:InlB B-repeat-containing protein [Ignavibacteria bacterium]